MRLGLTQYLQCCCLINQKYLNHAPRLQITENKTKSGASNTKLFEFRKDALEWLDEKHYRNVINSKKISNKAYMQAMRMHAEFLKLYVN